ncbi:MAG: oligosaccharide flippase family protein [Clostridia bacterium]
MRIHRSSVFYSVLVLTLSNLALQALGFIYRILLSRITGAEGMGVYQLVLPFYSVVLALAVSGLTLATARLSAEYEVLGNSNSARRVVVICFRIFLMLFICVAVPTVLFSEWISGTILGDIRCRTALLIVLPCLLCTGFENITKNYFFGIRAFNPPIISELSEQTVRIIAVGALLIAFRPSDPGKSAALIICGMVISEITSLLILRFFYAKTKTAQHKCPAPTLRQIAAIAAPVALSSVISNLLSAANAVLIPRRLIAFGMDATCAISTFGVLFGMTMPLLSLPIAGVAALTVVMVSKLAEDIAVKRTNDVRRKIGKTIHTTSLLSLPAMAILIPLGHDIGKFIFGEPTAGNFMLPLCIATLFSYYQISTTALLNGIGHERTAAAIILIGGVVQLVGTWLVGSIGIRGFLVGYIISSAVMAVLNFSCLMRKVSLHTQWRNWFFVPISSSILSGLAANFAHQMGVSLPISIALALATYLVATRIQGTSVIRYIKAIIPSR